MIRMLNEILNETGIYCFCKICGIFYLGDNDYCPNCGSLELEKDPSKIKIECEKLMKAEGWKVNGLLSDYNERGGLK